MLPTLRIDDKEQTQRERERERERHERDTMRRRVSVGGRREGRETTVNSNL